MFQEVNDVKDKWFLERWTKLTASENYKLIPSGTKGAVFSEGGYNYIKKKAFEMASVMWERPELEEVKSLRYGRMYEYPAYKAYISVTKNYSMKYLGSDTPLFIEDERLKNESGGSPDIISINSSYKIDAGAEIKCPINPMNHWERLKWKDQWDIKQNYTQCYVQIQNLMMITGATIWHFLSFDERMKQKHLQTKIIDVFPDKKLQDNLHFRLLKAVEEKYRIFNEYANL